MRIGLCDQIMSIGGLQELSAANSEAFRKEVQTAWNASLQAMEIDLSQTQFVDSSGLGALIAVHKWATCDNAEDVPVRLLNPPPGVQQVLELTRLHRTFEILKL